MTSAVISPRSATVSAFNWAGRRNVMNRTSSVTCDSTAGMVDPPTPPRRFAGPSQAVPRGSALVPDDDHHSEPRPVRAAPQGLTAGSTARLDDGLAVGERGELHLDRDAAEARYVLGAATGPGHQRGGARLPPHPRRRAARHAPVAGRDGQLHPIARGHPPPPPPSLCSGHHP